MCLGWGLISINSIQENSSRSLGSAHCSRSCSGFPYLTYNPTCRSSLTKHARIRICLAKQIKTRNERFKVVSIFGGGTHGEMLNGRFSRARLRSSCDPDQADYKHTGEIGVDICAENRDRIPLLVNSSDSVFVKLLLPLRPRRIWSTGKSEKWFNGKRPSMDSMMDRKCRRQWHFLSHEVIDGYIYGKKFYNVKLPWNILHLFM